MEVNNNFRKNIECVWKKNCVVSVIKLEFVCQTMFVWFFFLTRSLIDMRQIVTCTCLKKKKKVCTKPAESPLSVT